jgi:F-type H+-transporting ATPase subunit delta
MEEMPKHPTVFDTDQQQLGDIYAKALIGFGQKAGDLGGLLGELDDVTDALDGVPKLQVALESPRISVADKQALLTKAFGERVSKGLLNFLKIVVAKGRFDCLRAITVSARRMHDEMSGRVVATVTTAEPIDDTVRNEIAAKVGEVLGATIELREVVDPAIIGGMVVRVGDTVYDGSVANQLGQIRAKAVKRASDAIRGSIDKFITI